jgi:hypothetical protein
MKASELAVDWIRASEVEGGQTDDMMKKIVFFRSLRKRQKILKIDLNHAKYKKETL